MMDNRRSVDTQSRLYQHGVDKVRRTNENEHQKKIEGVMHSQMKSTALIPDNREGHRGVPAGEGLFALGQEKLRKQEEKKMAIENEKSRLANSTFKNKESDALRIQAFKREFRIRLSQILGSEEEINPKEQVLDYNLAAQVMHEMSFLQSKVSPDQERLIDDIYTIFKCKKQQNILAENLQNLLLVISGERDRETEVQNDEGNNKWSKAGVYDEETGLFYIREGEHAAIQRHYKDFRNNRLAGKKAVKNYAYKSAPQEPTFKPKLSNKTAQISYNRRQKLFANNQNVDVVSILLHPNNVQGNVNRLQQVHQNKIEEEERELTYKPRTNYHKNN